MSYKTIKQVLDRPYKTVKIVKKTRGPKMCRGCRKEINAGSTCIVLFEFLDVHYANDYFHNVDCVKIALNQFCGNVAETFRFLDEMIKKSQK